MNRRKFGNTFKILLVAVLIVALISPVTFADKLYKTDTKNTWSPFADTILYDAQIVTVDDDIIEMILDKEYKVKIGEANYPVIDHGYMAIKDGKIIAITDQAGGIAKYKGPETKVLDLEGRVVIPGLMDSHIHATSLGFDRSEGIELTMAMTADDVKRAIEINIAKHNWPADKWVRGYRWDEYRYLSTPPYTMPNRWDHLDAAAPQGQLIDLGRIFMGRMVSTSLFNYMGIFDDNPDTWPDWWLEDRPRGPGGWQSEDVVYRQTRYIAALDGVEFDGEISDGYFTVPTGMFVGRLAPAVINNPGPARNPAVTLRGAVRPALSYEERIKSIADAQDRLLEWGTVSFWEISGEHLKAYSETRARDLLKSRVTVIENYISRYCDDFAVGAIICRHNDNSHTNEAKLRERLASGTKPNDLLGDEFLKYMGVKYSLDGGYTTRGAWVSEPFENMTQMELDNAPSVGYGSPGLTDYNELYKLCKVVAEAGRSNHIHYCGDQGSRLTVDVYKAIYDEILAGTVAPYNGRELKLNKNGKPDLRWSLIHTYNPDEPLTSIMDDVAEYGFTVAVQPIFNYQEIQGWLNNVGLARVERSTPVKSFLEGGIIAHAGTDYGSAYPNPWAGIYEMLTRKCQVTGIAYGEGEKVGIADAIASMTILGAYSVFDEDWRGSLEVGKVADLVVLDLEDIFELDRDPELALQIGSEEEGEAMILLTMVGGETLFQKDGVTFPTVSLENGVNDWNFADTVLTNAQVVTVDDSIISMIKAKEYKVKKFDANYPVLDNAAVAIKDGDIIAVTESANIDPFIGPDTEVIDLLGNVIIPGLMDTHIHATGLGFDLTYGAELSYAMTADEVSEVIAANIAKHNWGPGQWVRGYRWDEYRYQANGSPMVCRWKHLDQHTTNGQFVNLGRIFRGVIVNTNVFNAMGIQDQDPTTWPLWWTEDLPSFVADDVIYREPLYIDVLGREVNVPTGAYVGRNAQGVLSSPGLDAAGRQLRAVRPPSLSYEDQLRSIADAQDRLLEWGTVSLWEPSGTFLRAYNEAYDRGWIKGRVIVMEGTFNNPNQMNDLRNRLMSRSRGTAAFWDNDRWMDGFGNRHVKAMGVKFNPDGGYTTRGAWISEPYENMTATELELAENTLPCGYGSSPIAEFDDLYAMCRMVAESGMSPHIHYCGDQGSRLTVDVYKQLYDEIMEGKIVPYNGRKLKLDQNGKPDLRWSLIHAYSPLEPKTRFLEDAADYGFVIAGQPIFNYQEIQGWLNNVGLERVERSQPVRSYLEGGCIYVSGTDYTSALPNPWIGIYAMLTRACQVTGTVYGEDETVGIADALATMTVLGAYSVFDEKWRGSIEVGKAADLVVLNLRDIYDLDRNPELCFDMDNRILMTMVDGEALFSRPIVPPKEGPPVYARVDGKPQVHFQDAIEYTLSLKEAVNVLAVDVEFVVDGGMLSATSFETLNGFKTLEAVNWTDNGDGTWTGNVRFGFEAGGDDEYGFTAAPYTEIAKFVFDSQKVMGDAVFAISSIEITGFDDRIGKVVYYNVIIEAGNGVTEIYNVYDLNKDGKVDLVDLGIMLLYVGYNKDDPQWDTLIKTHDQKGNPITPATCDVTGDGEVDMADLIELMANFGLNYRN